MIEKMILYTGGRYMASHQCELNVCANEMIGKTTLETEGRYGKYGVSHQCEFFNVSSVVQNSQRFLDTGSTQMVSLQYKLLNVHANKMTEKTIFYKKSS
jgi:hypothetical protein